MTACFDKNGTVRKLVAREITRFRKTGMAIAIRKISYSCDVPKRSAMTISRRNPSSLETITTPDTPSMACLMPRVAVNWLSFEEVCD